VLRWYERKVGDILFENLDLSGLQSINRQFAMVDKLNQEANEQRRIDAYNKSAKHVFDVIIREIKKVEDALDSEHEAAVKLASFGETILMNVEKIGYREPHFIYFYGSVNGQPASLIQHTGQLSFLVIAVKTEIERPARRIGFDFAQSPKE